MSTIDTAALRALLALAGAEHFHVVSTKTWCSGICDQSSGQCDGHETGRMTDVELAEEVESDDDLLCLYGANGQAEARAALIGNVHANTIALLDEIDRLRAELAAETERCRSVCLKFEKQCNGAARRREELNFERDRVPMYLHSADAAAQCAELIRPTTEAEVRAEVARG